MSLDDELDEANLRQDEVTGELVRVLTERAELRALADGFVDAVQAAAKTLVIEAGPVVVRLAAQLLLKEAGRKLG